MEEELGILQTMLSWEAVIFVPIIILIIIQSVRPKSTKSSDESDADEEQDGVPKPATLPKSVTASTTKSTDVDRQEIYYVYVTKTGSKYHCRIDCRGLNHAKTIRQETLSKAVSQGFYALLNLLPNLLFKFKSL